MQIRTIPKDTYPWWSCKINHKEYRYPSGATMGVPDEVAALIDGINAAKRQPEQAYIPHLPDITPADEGKVLKAVGGQWVLAEEAQTPDAAPLEVTMTLSESGGKTVVTFNKTAAEMFAAAAAGKMVIGTGQIPDEENTVTMTAVLPIEVFRVENGGSALYVFKMRCDMSEADNLFIGKYLAADDPVVLTEV